MEILYKGTFFEGPRWHDGHWYAADWYAHKLMRFNAAGDAQLHAEVPGQPGGSGWLPDGSMLIVSMTDRRVLRRTQDGALHQYADLSALAPWQLNDMVVTEDGHAYVGHFGFDAINHGTPKPASLIHIAPGGAVAVVAEDVLFPNGGVITQDGKSLIISETFGGRLTAFDLGPGGSLTNRRTWAELAPVPPWDSMATLATAEFAPDGMGLDAEGCIWVADCMNSRACRVSPTGEILDERKAPEGYGFYACMPGGPDGKTLLCCCAPGYSAGDGEPAPQAILGLERIDVPAARF